MSSRSITALETAGWGGVTEAGHVGPQRGVWVVGQARWKPRALAAPSRYLLNLEQALLSYSLPHHLASGETCFYVRSRNRKERLREDSVSDGSRDLRNGLVVLFCELK